MQRIGTRLAVSAALCLGLFLGARPSSALDIGVSITVEPPALPVYEQPEIPEPGYIWTPGYWAWGDDGYYWVPGTWVEPPETGLLWTPGYWGWDGGAYFWHDGYWGPQIGFYGGINYGFGYFGHGYDGGYWDHGAFRYNRAYNHFGAGAHITNVYNRTVVNNITVNRVSFNGGRGIQARADSREVAAEHEHHVGPVGAQRQHIESARGNPQLRASENHGHPGIAATARPGDFQNHVTPAHGAPQFHGNAPVDHAPAAPTPAGRAPERGFTPENRPTNDTPRAEPQQHAPPQAQFQQHEPPHQQEQHAPPQAQFQQHEPPHQQEQHAPPQAQFQQHEPPHQQEQHAPPQAQLQQHEPPHQQEQHGPPQPQAQQREAPHPQAPPPQGSPPHNEERRDDRH
jgi:hypothetical protein